jgi:putative sigma-54 modulation protein
MTETEAVKMELLGHSFFVFFNESTGSVNVLYRRDTGGYGVLVPQLSQAS